MKRLKFFTIFLTLAMVAAACGSSSDDTTTTTAGTPDATTTTIAPLGGSIEVLWVRGADHPDGEAFIAVLDAFTAATGVEINYQGLGDDLPTILSTRVEGGDPPDVALLPQPGLLVDLASRGALIDIEAELGSSVDANYAPAWRDLGSVDGTLYGVWYKASNKSTVFYNVKTFNDLGLTPPATWDEWLAVAGNLVDNGVTPIAVGGADGWTLSDWFENIYVRTAGQEKYVQLTNHEIPWTDASVVEAFTKMGELLGNDDFIAGGASGALQKGFVDSVVAVFGDPSEAAMVYEGDFVGGVATGETGAQPVVDFDFVPFPSIDGSPPAVMGGGDVAVAFTDSPETFALLKFLASPEGAAIWVARGGFNSPNKGIDISQYPDEVSRKSAEALANAEVFVFDLSDLVPASLGGTAAAGIWGGLQNWLENPGNLTSVLEQIEAEAEAAQPMG